MQAQTRHSADAPMTVSNEYMPLLPTDAFLIGYPVPAERGPRFAGTEQTRDVIGGIGFFWVIIHSSHVFLDVRLDSSVGFNLNIMSNVVPVLYFTCRIVFSKLGGCYQKDAAR
jgi:hypothetical protein